MQKRIIPGFQNMALLFSFFFIISCVPVKNLKYFNDIDQLQEPIVNPKKQKLIMPFDKLYVSVLSIDEKTNQLFNSNTNIPPSATGSVIGYLVDEAGYINFPFTGKIEVKGLAIEQAGAKIKKALSDYVPVDAVDVKYIENSITVMGEVQSQGMYQFGQDKLNIYEALALGGGISQYGNRKKVILIRQEGDKIMHHSLDLSDSKIALKDYYYIFNNDVLIVEPLKSKSWFQFNSSNFSTILTSITFLISTYFIFQK